MLFLGNHLKGETTEVYIFLMSKFSCNISVQQSVSSLCFCLMTEKMMAHHSAKF